MESHNLIEGIRAVARKRPHYPFKPVGIYLYDFLIELEDIIKDFLTYADLPSLRTALKHVSALLVEFEGQYLQCKYRLSIILEIECLLTSDSESCSNNLEHFIIESLALADSIEFNWLTKVLKITRAWLPGLFEYLKHEDIPRTNNSMEVYIRMLKGDLARILGKKFIHYFLLRRGEFWIFALEVPPEDVVVHIRSVAKETYFASREHFVANLNRSRYGKKFSVNPSKALLNLKMLWRDAFQY